MTRTLLVIGLVVGMSRCALATSVQATEAKSLINDLPPLLVGNNRQTVLAFDRALPAIDTFALHNFKTPQIPRAGDSASTALLLSGFALVLLRWLEPAYRPRRFHF